MASSVVVFSAAEAAFRFWLFFPGFFQFNDWMAVTLPGSVTWQYANHGQVLFISFVLRILYKLFGYHTWYVLLLNLVLWHTGLAAIVIAAYRMTSSRHALWLLLMTFWPAIWLYLPLFWKDFTFGLFLWFASGMCLLATTFKGPQSTSEKVWRRFFWSVLAVALLCALYWRHNAIVTVAPLCLYLTHRAVVVKANRNFGTIRYLARVGLVFFAVSVGLVTLVMAHPALLGKPGQTGMTRHIFLHDLVAVSVISGHDLIPGAAYLPEVTFKDVQDRYAATPTNIDRFIYGSARLLDVNAPDRLVEEWAKALCRYPMAYLRHKAKFAGSLLLRRPWLPTTQTLEAGKLTTWTDDAHYLAVVHDLMTRFPPSERKVTFTPTRLAIFVTARTWTRATSSKLVWYPGLSVVGLALGATWLVRQLPKKTCPPSCDRIVLSQCLFLASVATIAAIIAFAPHTNFRYAFPVVTTAIPAIIALAFGLCGARATGT